MSLEIRLLGPIALHHDGRPLPLPATRKAQSLLAFLVMNRERAWAREALAERFWPDRPPKKASHNLRTALWHVRRILPEEEILLSDSQTVQFNPGCECWLDVTAFEAGFSGDLEAASRETLQALTRYYRGEFLEGFYDDWCLEERYRLELSYMRLLERLVHLCQEEGDMAAGLAFADRLLQLDPLREDIHRQMMRLHAGLGDRSAVLRQYQRCQEALREHLHVEPAPETQALCRDLTGELPAPRAAGRVETAPAPGQVPLDPAHAPLVGRAAELHLLQSVWSKLAPEGGRFVLITGEGGVGKTRLVDDFANELQWRGGLVARGWCYEYEHPQPYHALTTALRSLQRVLPPPIMARVPAWALAEIRRLIPDLATRPNQPEAAPPAASVQEPRLMEALVCYLETVTGQGPLALILEDLHWASQTTVTFLQYLAARLDSVPLLLVGTIRRAALTASSPWQAILRRLDRARLAHHIALQRLSIADVTELLERLSGLGDDIHPFARRLYQDTQGNPFFLLETLRVLIEAGDIKVQRRRWQGEWERLVTDASLRTPPGVEGLIRARLARLSPSARELLSLAAVAGRSFDFEVLARAWGKGEEATLGAIDELLRRALILEAEGGMGRDYLFDHPKIREVMYASTHHRRRRRFHRLVAQAMLAIYGSPPETAVEIAYHFEQAGEISQAWPLFVQAGDHARSLYASTEAVASYRRALAILQAQGRLNETAHTWMKLGLAHHTAFEFRQARQAYEEGFAIWQKASKLAPGKPSPPAPHPLRVSWGDPVTLDSTMADDLLSACVIEQLFSGLLEQTPDLDVTPAVAHAWELLEGGGSYVFHLREDTHWSDGHPLTADDFLYAWRRTLDPSYRSPVARRLYDIRGARAFHQGQVQDFSRVGVQAPDPLTLIVELERPTSYFPYLVASTAMLPIPRHAVEKHGEAWTLPENIVSNGPFTLRTWRRGEAISMRRNPAYGGSPRGNADQLELILYDEPGPLELYAQDQLDIANLPLEEVNQARLQYSGEYFSIPALRTLYAGFVVDRPPFDNPDVRRALALAVDKEALANLTLEGHFFPAHGGFVPPGMPGHTPEIGLLHDPDRARELLSRAGYPAGAGFPALEWLSLPELATLNQDLQAQWRQTLGVEIASRTVDTYRDLRQRLERGEAHMFTASWGASYPDPDFFLRIGPLGACRWQEARYDQLVAAARETTDQRQRMTQYRQADRLLIEEAVALPLAYRRVHLLVKPWVRGFATSAISIWYWRDVILDAHAS